MIPFTKPYLPPKDKYIRYLDGIFERNWLTNNGPLVIELERRLKEYLEVDHLWYVTNGTIALQIAIKALDLKGEIITTPFSYVATTSSIVWEGCTPVFVDIDDKTFNIDPKRIEEAITEKTSALLFTHCFGNPCDIDAIQAIADKYHIKVIYDGAHAFGSQYKGKSVFQYGDISTCSLHATKIMHSIEGGFITTRDPEVAQRIFYMRNFGHDGPEKFNGVGINGKNSEFHAAMGLCVLDDIESILTRRKEIYLAYQQHLEGQPLQWQQTAEQSSTNYSYVPVINLRKDIDVSTIMTRLNAEQIYPRRYFYPALHHLSYVQGKELPVTDFISERILCLPMYENLDVLNLYQISNIL